MDVDCALIAIYPDCSGQIFGFGSNWAAAHVCHYFVVVVEGTSDKLAWPTASVIDRSGASNTDCSRLTDSTCTVLSDRPLVAFAAAELVVVE